MCSKLVKEWFVEAPWGKIAMISWGNPEKPPILLLHGYLDTAATFTFLVDKLSDNYYYVGLDMPGHGKSDPFPPGILITKLHIVEAVRVVVECMSWKTFTFISHSMGAVVGLCYNHFFPGKIEGMVLLDPKPAMAWYYVMEHHTDHWYKLIYNMYYDNYQKLNFEEPKSKTLDSWVSSVSRTRNITEEQSKIILSRSLIPTGNNEYKLSWEQRAKTLNNAHIPIATIYVVITNNQPPTLIVNAADMVDFTKIGGATKIFIDNFMKDCEEILPNFYQVTEPGAHDLHITNADTVSKHINIFLNSTVCDINSKSKL